MSYLMIFISAIFGFCTIGIKFLCVTLFDIQKRSTNPQGLLVLSFEISMMTIAFVLEMITMCPQYATFGPQLTNDGIKCNMNNMKKCITACLLVMPLAVFAGDVMVKAPEWKDFTPPAFADVKEPKGLGKLNVTATYWYNRRIDFENAISACSELEANDEI